MRNSFSWVMTELRYPSFNSNTSAELELDQGKVDWAGLFSSSLQQTYISRDPAHKHSWAPPGFPVTLYLNLTRYPFNLLPVRQAISLGIDRQQLDSVGESGYEPPAHEMRNELGRADRRAWVGRQKRNGRWSVKNPACLHEKRGQGQSRDVASAEKVKK